MLNSDLLRGFFLILKRKDWPETAKCEYVRNSPIKPNNLWSNSLRCYTFIKYQSIDDPCHTSIQFDPRTINRSVSKLTFLLLSSSAKEHAYPSSQKRQFCKKKFQFPQSTNSTHLCWCYTWYPPMDTSIPGVNCASPGRSSNSSGKAAQHQKSIINIPSLGWMTALFSNKTLRNFAGKKRAKKLRGQVTHLSDLLPWCSWNHQDRWSAWSHAEVRFSEKVAKPQFTNILLICTGLISRWAIFVIGEVPVMMTSIT